MRRTFTVSVPEELGRELDAVAARDGLTRSDVVRESLRDHLFFSRFQTLRQRMLRRTSARPLVDEDVFKRVS